MSSRMVLSQGASKSLCDVRELIGVKHTVPSPRCQAAGTAAHHCHTRQRRVILTRKREHDKKQEKTAVLILTVLGCESKRPHCTMAVPVADQAINKGSV